MEYEFRLVEFEDSEIQRKIVDLQNIVYADRGTVFTVDRLKFWYTDNPDGKVISFNAFYGDEIVAHYACIPTKMNICGRIVSGLLDISTVTHPEHRGKGLFKKLATITYDYAREKGYEFILGVANANSFPGYMKYFDFKFIGRLDVKWGIGKIELEKGKDYSVFWNEDRLKWRLNRSIYTKKGNNIYGTYMNIPFISTFMGLLDDNLIKPINLRKRSIFRPFNLYIGLGADLSHGLYFNVPKFIKHSPFNLIFLDLTGTLPSLDKDNISFQLLDFDVA